MLSPDIVSGALASLQLDKTELQHLIAALAVPPRSAIRLRQNVLAESLPFPTTGVGWHPQGRIIEEVVRPGGYVEFAAGNYYIQDVASLLALTLLDAQPGERICDLCASPGGKSTAILESLQDRGWLLSNEAVHSRLGPLEFNLAKHGLTRYVLAQSDPDVLARRLGAIFDAVLVDAPCSGQSLVGRGKQTEASFALPAIQHCAARQSRILNAAAQLVRPGGRLVYSTCTFAFAENEGQIESFLAGNPEWELEPCALLTPWRSEYQDGYYRLWPHRDFCGGSFAARIRRQRSESIGNLRDFEHRDAAFSPTSWPSEFAEWGRLSGSSLYRSGMQCFAWPQDVDAKLLTIGTSGPEVCFRKGSTWFPSYALAMRHDPNWQPHAIHELNRDDAVRFLGGQSLVTNLRGWSVAQWNGRPLGWLKGDGKRWKNHLPKPGRLSSVR